jgi:hypothetical protein
MATGASQPPPPTDGGGRGFRAPEIRHAGRALIRGKIRRVWRPRYLELLDTGCLRYYELPDSSSPSGDCAAAADPGGGAIDESAHDRQRQLLLLPPACGIPKHTLRVQHARILDGTTLRDMHAGLPRGSFGFVLRGRRLFGGTATGSEGLAPSPRDLLVAAPGASTGSYATLLHPAGCQGGETVVRDEPRDYLCAVSSLEEAQMWVVALQWASHQVPPASPPRTVSAERIELGSSGGSGARSEPPPVTATAAEKARVAERRSSESAPAAARAPFRRKVSAGKVVVSKVVQYRVIRLSGWWNFEIAYEIHGMLVDRGSGRAEQWSCLRTADDFQGLVTDLCKELGPALLDRAQLGPIRQLPRWADRPTPGQLHRSLSVVDSILRSLVMDAPMVNSASMKVFLGLETKTTIPAPFLLCWWQPHDASSVLSRRTEPLPAHVDQYVRQWLLKRPEQSSVELCTVTLLQRPWMVLGSAGFSTFCIVPLARFWQTSMPVFTVRLDCLVLTWMGAAYLGKSLDLGMSLAASPGGSAESSVDGSIPPSRRRKLSRPVRKSKPAQGDSPSVLSADSHESGVLVHVDTVKPVEEEDEESDGEATGSSALSEAPEESEGVLSSPLPEVSETETAVSCWSQPAHDIFHVRGVTYLEDRIKIPSGPAPLTCRGVDVWITENPERHIARHPAVLGGKLGEKDTFLVNFLLPFGNFVAYFDVPPIKHFPDKLRGVWKKFLAGDQEYRDARLKLLPVVVEGPWIVKTAVGPGKSPALLGKVIPLQYFFRDPTKKSAGVYEVDVIITASTIAKGILSVVKGHTKTVTIAFAFIIEAAELEELPETVLCTFQVHSLHLEDCPVLPECNLDEVKL